MDNGIIQIHKRCQRNGLSSDVWLTVVMYRASVRLLIQVLYEVERSPLGVGSILNSTLGKSLKPR